MKKVIFPLICAVALFFLLRTINPGIEAVGIVLVVAIGLGIGSLLNKAVFKRKGTNRTIENEDAK